MYKMQYRFMVNMPAETLFDLTQNYELRHKWDSLLKSAEFLTPLPIKQGTQLHYTTYYGSSMTVEYVAYKPPKIASIKMISTNFWLTKFAGGWQFKPINDEQTQVTFAYHVEANYLPKLLTPIFNKIFGMENRRRAKKLKHFAESLKFTEYSTKRNTTMSTNPSKQQDTQQTQPINPITMYYDDACVICSTEAHQMQARNPNGIRLVPVDEGIDEINEAGYTRTDAMTYLCVQDGGGNWHTHMDAVRLLYKTAGVFWAGILYKPVIKQLGDFTYPFVARNRYRIPDWVTRMLYGKEAMQACQNGVCKINPAKR